MKTLIIYDNTGKIYYKAAGDYTKPDGLPYIEVDVPQDKYVSGVDVETQTAILSDYPKQQSELNAERLDDLEEIIAEMIGG